MDQLPAISPAAELDAQLAGYLVEARLGNLAAFEKFYSATIRLVLPTVRRICGDNLYEDVLTETYFRAWTTLNTFDASRGSALVWLRMIARSRARDVVRAERVRGGGAVGAMAWEADESPSPDASPQEQLERAQESARLQAAVASLAPMQRELIGLAYTDECTQPEMAARTRLPLGTVKTLIRRSHIRLRGIMQPPQPTPTTA